MFHYSSSILSHPMTRSSADGQVMSVKEGRAAAPRDCDSCYIVGRNLTDIHFISFPIECWKHTIAGSLNLRR